MQCTTKKLPKGQVELTFTVELDEIKNALNSGVRKISEEKPIEGYRPGKAGYEVIKARFGEQAIYEAALPEIVQKNYVAAIKENNLNSYGEPEIKITKLAPNNPIEFIAVVTLVPEITNLAKPEDIKVKSEEVVVEDAEIDGTISELIRMQTKEVRVTRELQDSDKVVVDLDMFLDKVPLDGGQAKDHAIYLDQEYYVPGMKEKILGMKEGESKEFELKFPKDHFQKNIAGKDVGFKVTVKEIYELQHPEADEEFAKNLGQESLSKLKDLLKNNILKEKTQKEEQRVEGEILEKLIEKSRFGDIPESMIDQEVHRMVHELEHSIEERGMKLEDYLQSIKKTMEQIKLDFAQQAMKRVKTALYMKEYGEREKVEIADTDLMAEVETMLNNYKDNAEAQQTIKSEEYQDYIRASMRNRKVLELLKEKTNIVNK